MKKKTDFELPISVCASCNAAISHPVLGIAQSRAPAWAWGTNSDYIRETTSGCRINERKYGSDWTSKSLALNEKLRTQNYAKYSMVCERRTTDSRSRLLAQQGEILNIPHFRIDPSDTADLEDPGTVESQLRNRKSKWNGRKGQN